MKKYILIISMITLLVLAAAPSYAKEGLYVGGNIGLGMMRDADIKVLDFSPANARFETDNGYVLGAAVGYIFPFARFEGEISYQKNDFTNFKLSVPTIGSASAPISGDVSNLAFLLNGYYDFKNQTAFTPYLGAGLGFARVKTSAITLKSLPVVIGNIDVTEIEGGLPAKSDTVFAYQVGAGVGMAVTPQVTVDLKYRYYATQNVKIEDGFKFKNRSHQIFLGLRYAF